MKEFFRQKPLIYLITDGAATVENFSEKCARILRLIENAIEAKIRLIQIREKNLPAELIFELTESAARITRQSETKLLVNDRADIAYLAGADGVHLTSNSVPTEIVRRKFPKEFIVGVSCHTPEACAAAKADGADFATLSPIFFTPGKGEPKGSDVLRDVCERLKPFPVIALGGVDETNYESVLATAQGFAAIRFLNDAENLRKLAAIF